MGARRRRGLADLIGEVGAEPQREPGEGESWEEERAVEGAMRPAARDEEGGPTGGGGEAPAERRPGGGVREARQALLPKYLALTRKEARLRGDQVDALASLARRVNRQKTVRGGERITENTLIRVAVDWLLSQEAYVGGSSEEEIRRRLGVPEPRFGKDV